jgi:hypothetical protein
VNQQSRNEGPRVEAEGVPTSYALSPEAQTGHVLVSTRHRSVPGPRQLQWFHTGRPAGDSDLLSSKYQVSAVDKRGVWANPPSDTSRGGTSPVWCRITGATGHRHRGSPGHRSRSRPSRARMIGGAGRHHQDRAMSPRANHPECHEQLITALLPDIMAPRPAPRSAPLPALPAPSPPAARPEHPPARHRASRPIRPRPRTDPAPRAELEAGPRHDCWRAMTPRPARDP